MRSIILIILVCSISFCSGQVIIAKNTQVTPRCGSQLISIEVNFDPTQLPGGKFTDWIIVGVSGRPECRLRGNGETKYIIEIAVFNDPCLTQIPARNVFQNRIRIGKNPVVILEEDQSVTVKCIYGLPTVETMTLPIINSNFNIDNFGHPEAEIRTTSSNSSDLSSSISQSRASLSVDESTKESMHQSFENSESIDSNQRATQVRDSSNFGGTPNLLPTQGFNSEQFAATTLRNGQNMNGNWEANRNTNAPNNFQVETGNDEAINGNSMGSVPGMGNSFNNFDTLNTGQSSKKRSFSMIFITAVILIVLVFLALLGFCLMFLRRKLASRNRRLLVDRVSDRTWPANTSNDEYGTTSPPPVAAKPKHFDNRLESHNTSVGRHLFRSPAARNFPDLSIVIKSDSTNENDKTSGRRRPSVKISKKKTPAPNANLPLKSNLEEFVSKTYALGEYNNLASPAYAYTSEIHDEREVDVGNDVRYEKPYEKRSASKPRAPRVEDGAVSSFRSITEIVHAAETATTSQDQKGNGDSSEMQNILMDCVLSIRGFGYRKLTEQEIIRWKNLIQQDSHIRELLVSSKSSAEIENIFEHEEYKNMFTSSKWHEIALCVHRALTNSLDRSNSRSELQLFVGNVHTDW
ncbi:ZP domain-containing protein [Caenorhabditis elegans]|uniref:ZP domain-containing protein n=1 Tax=Caenorhabditis elegans TaxID=6239 RepID=Q95Q52_CAEEL|nr:ZP domain-containing protein [Caenorhabditis elegans]CCD62873.1 ZP domain-containing protein [Caenorhabditis elegans]|eukprot:NP_508192.2 CUTiclin-Like [Caenorhabditis elegans]